MHPYDECTAIENISFTNVDGNLIYMQTLITPERCKGSATEVCFSNGVNIGVARWLLLTAVLSVILAWLQLHFSVHPAVLLLLTILQLCMLIYRTYFRVVSERLLLVAGLGAHVTTTFLTGRKSTHFVPWRKLKDVIIAETITMQRVLFYMALLVKGEPSLKLQHSPLLSKSLPKSDYEQKIKGELDTHELLPLFQHLWPRLVCLRFIYRNCRVVLQRGGKANPEEFTQSYTADGLEETVDATSDKC